METNANQVLKWNSIEKFFFCFAFLFFSLFILFENNGAFPFFYLISSLLEVPLHSFIPWVGKHVLHLPYPITVFTNGSGDTTYDYIILFCICSVSLIGAGIWSFADHHRPNYIRLYYWLSVAIRFYVGCMLVNYGLVKIFKCQFPAPDLYRLNQTYGESSPMGLAWAFLGFSKGYNLFMGIAEFAAILLLFRRTLTAGLLITLMTTSNVMAVNYFYDVPVKILSTMLVIMTVFLLLRDAKRLFLFFFTGLAISLPVIIAPEIKLKGLRILKFIFKGMILIYIVLIAGYEAMEMEKLYGDGAPKPRLYGIYKVKSMIRNVNASTQLQEKNWKQLIVESEYSLRVMFNDNSTQRYFAEAIDSGKIISLVGVMGNKDSCYFNYSTPQAGILIFNGQINQDKVEIVLQKDTVSRQSFELIKTGFHWINEYPNNK